ncbi:KLTH0C09526p [Lachancea thermotolerans CBS 6340]|uniref:KLTH0C09526p n=1 Tax=Lachancea thermotolerans (strain ATCC 56472 / CBS 6340 / NRRL Y-8284) TaxID=559295 RepID=C5DEI6_LACTC|nr:KLTH0C09526p [Lachancea thermotolerans CBS 6340]CAR22197.1 KLTH0C09526p [Lachancea thermotolerans CBS 6340]
MSALVNSNFEEEVGEYVSRAKFRKRIRSWLSTSKEDWAGASGCEKHTAKEVSYDTEQLDFLLRLSGLQETQEDPRRDSLSLTSAEKLCSSVLSSGDEAEPTTRRGRILQFYRKLKSSFHRPSAGSLPGLREKHASKPWINLQEGEANFPELPQSKTDGAGLSDFVSPPCLSHDQMCTDVAVTRLSLEQWSLRDS